MELLDTVALIFAVFALWWINKRISKIEEQMNKHLD